MKPTLTVRLRLWPALLVAALALALPAALAANASAAYDGPALDTGLYLPADPGVDGGTYQPGVPDTGDDGSTVGTASPGPAGPASGSGDGGATAADPASGENGETESPAEPTTGGEGDKRAREETERALRLVDDWLLKRGCNTFISGSSSKSAFDIFHELMTRRGADPGIEERPNEVKKDEEGYELEAVAVMGALRSPKIILYNTFYRGHPNEIRDASAELLPTDRAPGEDEIRAMLILHELAHITGVLPVEHFPADPDGFKFDRSILDRCLHNRETPISHPPVPTPGPAPIQRPGGDDAGGGGGGYIDPGTGSGGGEVSPALPDSDAPVLTVCCDEVPGGQTPDSGGGSPYAPDANYDDPFDPVYDNNPSASDDGGYDDGGYDDGGYDDGGGGYDGGGYDGGGYGGGGGGAGCARGDYDPFDFYDDVDVFCTA